MHEELTAYKFTPHFYHALEGFLSSCSVGGDMQLKDWRRRRNRGREEIISAVGKPQRSRRKVSRRKCHLLSSFSRNKAEEKTLSIYGLHSGSNENENCFHPEEIRL